MSVFAHYYILNSVWQIVDTPDIYWFKETKDFFFKLPKLTVLILFTMKNLKYFGVEQYKTP